MTEIGSAEPNAPNLEERIRVRAYYLYTHRGQGDGHALDDWLQAEEEIVRGVSRHWAWRHEQNKHSSDRDSPASDKSG
jgi:hypothetical protein